MPKPQLHGVVRSYEDQQRWIEHHIAVCAGVWGEERLLNNAEGLCLSTAFSGTGGPEVSFNSVRCGLSHLYGKSFESEAVCVGLLFLFDQSQYDLLMLSDDACVFSDMVGFIVPAAAIPLKKHAANMTFEDLEKVLTSS